MKSEEKNKVIAEFMNCNKLLNNEWDCKFGGISANYIGSKYLAFDYLWDWLMPVVEKIEEMGYSVHIIGTYGTRQGWCKINGVGKGDFTCNIMKDAKIQAVYEAIYQFITQTNERQI